MAKNSYSFQFSKLNFGWAQLISLYSIWSCLTSVRLNFGFFSSIESILGAIVLLPRSFDRVDDMFDHMTLGWLIRPIDLCVRSCPLSDLSDDFDYFVDRAKMTKNLCFCSFYHHFCYVFLQTSKIIGKCILNQKLQYECKIDGFYIIYGVYYQKPTVKYMFYRMPPEKLDNTQILLLKYVFAKSHPWKNNL